MKTSKSALAFPRKNLDEQYHAANVAINPIRTKENVRKMKREEEKSEKCEVKDEKRLESSE